MRRFQSGLIAFCIFLGMFGPVTGAADKPKTRKEKQKFYSKQQRVGDLKVGDEAPDFELKSVDGKEMVRLSSFEGKREVVLIFGSYT